MEILELITKAFCTRWQNVDPDVFFDCGFRLFGKSFSYNKFYERKILLLYIENDKQRKRKDDNIKDVYEQSDFFVKEWMETKQYRKDVNLYRQYGMMLQDGMKAPIKHYLLNKIDKYMLSWLISNKFVCLEETEKNLIPLIIENYWSFSEDVNKVINNKTHKK